VVNDINDKIDNGKIYKITNKKNGKVYIGLTTKTLLQRWKKHLYSSTRNFNNNKFYNAINKYGSDAFKMELIQDRVVSFERLKELEIEYIRIYNSYEQGYNSTIGGDGSVGYKHTQEAIEKIAQERTGTEHSLETRRKISEALRGRILSDEHKQNISNGSKTVSIYQVNFDYEIVNVFESITEANVSIGRSKKHGGISRCLYGKQLSSFNCYWVTLQDYFNIF
jgi:group I intron endonuclease